MEPRAQIKK